MDAIKKYIYNDYRIIVDDEGTIFFIYETNDDIKGIMIFKVSDVPILNDIFKDCVEEWSKHEKNKE